MYTWEDLATNVHTQYKLYLSCNSKNKDLCSIPNNKRMKLEINCTQFTCNSWLIATREIKEDIWLRKYKLNFNWIFLIIYTCLILNSDRIPASLVWHTCKFPFFHSCLKPQAIIQMLEPFLRFVLQDPKVTVNQLVRQQLITSLLQTASSLLKCPGMPLLFTL